jgi:hypothetical protein
MKKLGVIATSLLFAAPVLAQSVGEKSGQFRPGREPLNGRFREGSRN